MSKIFRWIFRKELARLENIPEQVKNINEAIVLLNTKLDATHESMQKELARCDDDIQKVADLATQNQDDLSDLKTFLNV